MDKQVRRILLKPLAARPKRNASRKALLAALDRLDDRARGAKFLAEMKAMLSDPHDVDPKSFKNPDVVRKWVDLAQALFDSGSISRQEYTFFAAWPVEHIHDSRCYNGVYEELKPISQAIDAVREENGLGPDESWKIGEGPREYLELNKRYEACLERRFLAALREFGLDDLADIRKENPKEFDRLRERGRRSEMHKKEIVPAIKDFVIRYEEDARRAASVKAYSAAVVLLGAAVEGLLLLRCLRSKKKSQNIASSLPKRKKPKSLDDPTKWNFENLIETCLAAGWLPPMSTEIAQYNSAGLANILRRRRNLIHPGRYVRERPWVETDEEDYRDAEAIYVTLLNAVLDSRGRAKKKSGTKSGPPAGPTQTSEA